MTDDIVRRLLESDGMEVFTAGDGHKAIRADTALMREAAHEIARMRRALIELGVPAETFKETT